ncbi:transcriptional activator hap3, partial [Ascosphaera acerosa]
MSVSPTATRDVGPSVGAHTATASSSEEQHAADQELAGAQADGYELPGGFEVKEQDRWLPIANVARIMKTALPDNAKIAKEAKECMQECVSEFISFVTSEAADKCQSEKRKTVNGEDILFSLTSLGFENYKEALQIYLTRYRE